MKNSAGKSHMLWKMIGRDIKGSFGRFFSVLAIIAIGTGFFSGVRITTPVMINTVNDYYIENRFFDYRILSTIGWEETEVSRLAQAGGVSAAQGAWQYDVICQDDYGSEAVYKVHSITYSLNLLQLKEGRLPENSTECLIDNDADNRMNLALGDEINFSDENDPDTLDAFSGKSYTVVGFVDSSLYIDFERGTTSIGNGEVLGFMYLPEEAFTADAYTEVYVKLDTDYKIYSDQYNDQMDDLRPEWEALIQDAADERYTQLYSDAEQELADAREEFEDKKAEGEQELKDAAVELAEGKAELEDAAAELSDARAELDDAAVQLSDARTELDDAAAELADGKTQLDDAQQQLADSKSQLDSAWAELSEAKEELDAAEAELKEYGEQIAQSGEQLDQAEKQLAEAKAVLDATEAELAEAAAQLAAWKEGLDTAGEQLDSTYEQLTAAQEELDQYSDYYEELTAQRAELEAQKSEVEAAAAAGLIDEETAAETLETITQAISRIDASLAEIAAQKEALNAGWEQYNSALAEYQTSLAQYEAAKAQYDEGVSEYEAGLARYESSLAEYNAGKAAYELGVSEYEAGKAAYENGLKEYNDGLAEYNAGLAQYNEGLAAFEQAKAEYEDGLASYYEGLAEYDQAVLEYTQGVEDYNSGLAEYQDGMKEYADAQAEYEDAKKTFDEEIADAEKELADAEEDLAAFEAPDTYLLERGTNIGYACFESDSEIIKQIARVLPMFFILVAILVCMTTMTRMVDERRGQIGIMKGLGYSRGDIMFTFLAYAGTAAAIGCIVGYAAGILAFPSVIWFAYKMMYIDIPLHYMFDWKLASAVFVISVAAACGTTYLTCRNELVESAAGLMRPKAPKAGKRVFLERIPVIWNRLKFMHKVSVRNILRYKKRFFMMIVGISGCTALLITGFGIKDSIATFVTTQFNEIQTAQVGLVTDEADADDLPADLTDTMDELKASYFAYNQSSWDLVLPNKTKSITLLTPSDWEDIDSYFLLRTMKDEDIPDPGPGEALVSISISKRYGVNVGDTIILRNEDMETIEATVSGVFKNYVYNYVFISRETLENVTGSYSVNGIYVNFPEESDVYEAQAELAKCENVVSVSVYEDLEKLISNMMSSLNYVVLLIIFSAAALAFVVLYNLTNINILERIREIATIKVLGFRKRETSEYVFRENIVLTTIGMVIGLVLGVLLHSFVIDQIVVDLVYFRKQITLLSFILSIVLTYAFTFVVDRIMSVKLEKINMAESLKSVE